MLRRLFLLLFIIFVGLNTQAANSFSSMEIEEPLVIREPQGILTREFTYDARARVSYFVDNKTLKAVTSYNDWTIGETVALESQTPGVGIIAFVEITGIQNKQDGTFELTGELLRQSRLNFVQAGDQLMHLDLSTTNERYLGTTDLMVKDSGANISPKYKPLYNQGFAIGDTAQTLWEREFIVTFYGQIDYGLKKWLSVGTILTADLVGAWNAWGKAKVYESYSNVVSVGLKYGSTDGVQQVKSERLLNLNIFWDSISSESVIGHTTLSLALVTYNEDDSAIVRTLGGSSLRTGYEVILDNWDRVLLGPIYNFSNNTVGGYLSYMKIWDRFHVSATLNSVDVSNLVVSDQGYYGTVDAYWRF